MTNRRPLALAAGTLVLGLLALATAPALAHDGDKTHNGVDQKIAELTAKLKDNPDDVDALVDRGYLYLMFQDEVENGLADFARLVELKPGYEPGHVCLAIARFRMGDLAGALEQLEPLCDAGTKNPAAWATRGEIRHALHQEAGALADLDHALDVTPKKWPLAYVHRAEAKAALGQDAGALEDFKRALEIDPRHIDTLRVRGRFYGEREKWQEAADDLDAASQYARGSGRPDGPTHAERARIWRRRGFALQAEQEANTAVDLYRKEFGFARSNAEKARILLAIAEVTAEARLRPAAALDALDEALALAPDRPDLLGYRVTLLQKLGDAAALEAAKQKLLAVAKAKLPRGCELAFVESSSR